MVPFKDTLPVFYYQNCLHHTFLPYTQAIYKKTANHNYPCMLNYKGNNDQVEKMWPDNLALFIYISTHNVETVTKLDFSRYIQWSQWSHYGLRGPGFDFRLCKELLGLLFVCCCWFYMFGPKTMICHDIKQKPSHC